VVYCNLANLENILGAWRGTWSQNVCVLPVKAITCKVGIWQMPGTQTSIWVLRKHPGLAMLNAEETEEAEDEAENENDI
jgi:hypothetical protein